MDDILKFFKFSESLKLAGNEQAEIEGRPILDDIYTDLLPGNGILNKVNQPTMTILTGSRGTGKSTIFSKSRNEINRNAKYSSIYVDIKTLYDASLHKLPSGIETLQGSVELIEYLTLVNVIHEIITHIKAKLEWQSGKENIKTESGIETVFKNIEAAILSGHKNFILTRNKNKPQASIETHCMNHEIENNSLTPDESKNLKAELDRILITHFDLKKLVIDYTIEVLSLLRREILFIYMDDYSAIKRDAQVLLMDRLIIPIHELGDDFIKFKIAAYQRRFYYGSLDSSKIDKISLDFSDAFYYVELEENVVRDIHFEYLAVNYIERLLVNRFNVYFQSNIWEKFFEMSPRELYGLLLNSTINTPRKIGFILSFCYESTLIHGIKIDVPAIENAVLRYYRDIIESHIS